jgi:hypothetical protein
MNIIEVCQSLENRECDFANDIDINRPDFLVYAIQRTLVRELHANADVWVCKERAVERNDILRVAVVHNLQFAENLLAYRGLSVDENDLRKKIKISIAKVEVPGSATERRVVPTFLAIMVPVGTCSTFLTLPPFPCPSSCRSFKSSFLRSYFFVSPFISIFARVLERVS